VISGVARIPTPGSKAIFTPPPIKTAEFEVKNVRRKSAEEAKAYYIFYLLLLFNSRSTVIKQM